MKQRLLQQLSFAKPLRLALVLFTLLLTLPQTVWGVTEEVTKTITFNKDVSTVSSGINNSTMSVSINEQITGGASTSYDGVVNILDSYSLLDSYSGTTTGGAVFTLKSTIANYSYDKVFTIEIPGNYPTVPTQVTLNVAYTNSDNGTDPENAKIQVGDYGNGNQGSVPDPSDYIACYHYYHPYRSHVSSMTETTLTYTGNNTSGLGTNRDYETPLSIFIYLHPGASFTIKEATITYNREVYGISVAGTSVKSDNATDVLGDGKVSYNAATKTLKLDGANINYTSGDAITASTTDPLNVNVVGANSISCGDHKAFNTSGNLVFQTRSGVAPGQLTITSTSNIDSQSYYTCGGSVTYEDGLAARNLTSSSVLISTNYGINVEGTVVTSDNATDVLNNNTVSYDASDNILTLDGATISGAISTERDNLTIKLKGTNTITTTNSYGVNGIISDKNTGTLTFTKEGANASLTIASNVSVIRGFASLNLENSGLYTNTSTPYKIKSDSSYPRLADATKEESDTTYSITNIIIGDVVTYQLWVAGNQATYSNASNVTGAQTPTVAFNATDNILTLNGFSVNAPIFSNLDNLTILFQGDNNLGNNSSGASGYISSLNTNAPLILKGGTGNCTLVLDDDYGHAVISGFASVTFDGSYLTSNNSCGYATGTDAAIRDVKGGIVQSATITTTPHYPLWVSSTQVTPTNNTNVLGDATVSFDYDSRTLTLNGTSISNSNAIESWLDKLIINLKGNNSVSTYVYGYSAICSGIETATLTIAKDATATGDVQLSLNTGGNPLPPIIKGFKSVDYNGLNFVSKTGTTPNGTTTTDGIFSSGTIYPLWIDGVRVTDANNSFNGTTSGTLVYDGSSNTITMTDYVSTFTTGHAIETGIDGLKVKLIGGNNAITCNDANGYAFYNGSGNTDASIQFVKDNTTSKLTLQTTPTNPFGGFANGSITYNELVYYPTGKYIAIPTAPTMTEDNDKVKLDRDNYEGGTIAIKYSIAYADGKTADVTDATYSAPFEMAAPGTVTAWVDANGAQTSSVKGKYFGYQGDPLSMMVNEELTPVLIPSIESGDGIDYSTTTAAYESSDTNIATFANKKINSVAIGTVTLTTRLATNNNTIALLNHNGEFTTQLTVSKVFNVTFAEGANYMIYYNSAHDNLTIPDGMTAAIVTGVASSGTTVETTTLTFIPETSAVLLGKGTSTGTPTVTKYNGKDTAPTGNKLKYVDNTPVATTGYEYILYKDEFVKATGSIPDGKCYLDLTGAAPAPAPARSLGIDNDGTTDIRELRMENEERDEWYDLQGRRIEQPTKAGLYIKNGKKVIVNTK